MQMFCALRENSNAPESQYSLTFLSLCFFFFFHTAVEESGDIVSFCGFAKLKKVVGWHFCLVSHM